MSNLGINRTHTPILGGQGLDHEWCMDNPKKMPRASGLPTEGQLRRETDWVDPVENEDRGMGKDQIRLP